MHDPEWGTPTRIRISPKLAEQSNAALHDAKWSSPIRGRSLEKSASNNRLHLSDVHSSSPLRSRASSCSKHDAPRQYHIPGPIILLTAALVASLLYILVWQRDSLKHPAPVAARLAFTNFTADLESFDTTAAEEHNGPDTLFRKGAINRGQSSS
jgi:hypothetical protein